MAKAEITVTIESVCAWLIWSNEHSQWWRPFGNGYTHSREKAGRFSFEEAARYVLQANQFTHDPQETLVPDFKEEM